MWKFRYKTRERYDKWTTFVLGSFYIERWKKGRCGSICTNFFVF